MFLKNMQLDLFIIINVANFKQILIEHKFGIIYMYIRNIYRNRHRKSNYLNI